MASKKCTHLNLIKQFPKPKKLVCPECIKINDEWVYLRQCLVCGYVGCCDSSKNKHATAHFKKTGHPLIINLSVQDDGGEWRYCYKDKLYLE